MMSTSATMADDRTMRAFLQYAPYKELVNSPNGEHWWHSMPLPDGKRINGAHDDKYLQTKMWDALLIPPSVGLLGKRVLDIGANDGFFSLAALAAGASSVTSIDKDWDTWPKNINYASQAWQARPEVITGDFRTMELGQFDVILFLGVIYHLQDVFGAMQKLHSSLVDHGVLYIETQGTQVNSALPIFEYASDAYSTTAPQGKETLRAVGISNYLFPNPPAVFNLACSYGFSCEFLNDPSNRYTRANPLRHIYRLTKLAAGERWAIPGDMMRQSEQHAAPKETRAETTATARARSVLGELADFVGRQRIERARARVRQWFGR
jgi:protein-L-isoaspartate O-methyltransferase